MISNNELARNFNGVNRTSNQIDNQTSNAILSNSTTTINYAANPINSTVIQSNLSNQFKINSRKRKYFF